MRRSFKLFPMHCQPTQHTVCPCGSINSIPWTDTTYAKILSKLMCVSHLFPFPHRFPCSRERLRTSFHPLVHVSCD